MHLVSYVPKLGLSSVYHKPVVLTRPDSLARIFRNLRIDRNLTAEALSEIVGVSCEYVRRVECGSRFPSLKFCLSCGDLFGANPDWVKSKWVNERVSRFGSDLRRKLCLND